MQAICERNGAPPETKQTDEPVRLDIGCGKNPRTGFVGVDRKLGKEAYPLEYEDGTVDEIVASHVLEHFPHGQVETVLADWVRVLKPGGVLRVAVPDFEWIARNYLDGKNIEVQGYIMGGHVDANDHHGCIFDRDSLEAAMRSMGLVDVRRWKPDRNDCSSLPCSLNLVGRKHVQPSPPSTVRGVISMGRLGFTESDTCMLQAAMRLGIPIERVTSCFWGAALTRLIERNMDQCDYVLTIDHDSVFEPWQVARLIQIMDSQPDIDALFPVQMKRAGGMAMLMARDENGQPRTSLTQDDLDCDALPVTNGHFGLTLLRTSSLKRLHKPWFHAKPDADGSWHDGRVDEDIWFWQQMERQGMRVCIAPHVVLGHAELVVTWPDARWRTLFQPIGDYTATRTPPKEAWS